MGGKAAKAWSLTGFCEIENGGSRGNTPVKWPPLCRPSPPKLYLGSPDALKSLVKECFFAIFDHAVLCVDSRQKN